MNLYNAKKGNSRHKKTVYFLEQKLIKKFLNNKYFFDYSIVSSLKNKLELWSINL